MKGLEAIWPKSLRPIRQRRINLGDEPRYQTLDKRVYACGLILGLAFISTENPNFKIASIIFSCQWQVFLLLET